MPEIFEIYERFDHFDDAEETALRLNEHGIPFQLEEVVARTDALHIIRYDYTVLKLRPSDFSRANEIKEQWAGAAIMPNDYYLQEFSTEELTDILLNSEEWSAQDVEFARRLLRERGNEMEDFEIEMIRQQKRVALTKGRKGDTAWIIFGYGAAIFGGVLIWFFMGSPVSFGGCLLGIVSGLYFLWYKTIDEDGNKYYTFDTSTRKHGKAILIISALVIGVFISIGLYIRISG